MKLTEVAAKTVSPSVDMEQIIAALRQLLPRGTNPTLDKTGQAVTFKFNGHDVDVVYRGSKWDLVVDGERIDTFDRKMIDNLDGLERLAIALKGMKK